MELDLVALRELAAVYGKLLDRPQTLALIDRCVRAEKTIRLTAIAKDKTRNAAIEECREAIKVNVIAESAPAIETKKLCLGFLEAL